MLNRPTVKATATERPVRIRTADLIAVSPSGPGPASAPEARLPKPASGSRPLRAMATKLRRRAASTAATALQSGSRAAVKRRVRIRLGAAAELVDQRAARVGRIALAAEREVFLDAEGEAEGAAVAVFGEMDDAGRAGRAGIGPRGDAVAEESAAEGAQAGEDFGELGLAVAVDAGHAEDFAATQREGEAAQGGAVAVGK